MSDTTNSRRQRRATIEDVAAAADVSVATVSRALRGLPNVAESTRARVAEAAAALSYRPDPAAMRLAAGRTHTAIVVVPHLSSWYFSHVVAGAEAVCAEAGYDVLVVGVGAPTERIRLLDDDQHIERRADGVILVNIPPTVEQARSLDERGVALSTVGSIVPGHPAVRVDDEYVGRLAAEHLTTLGHRRIGLISGETDDPMNFEVPHLRYRGFVDGLATAGLTLDDALVHSGSFGVDGGQEAAATILDEADPPTALFAMSDEMAFGALMELTERGLVAGSDISVIGVDDHEFARVVGLTTIRQHVAEQGATAARALLGAIAERAAPGSWRVTGGDAPCATAPVELVERTTTGPPPPEKQKSPATP